MPSERDIAIPNPPGATQREDVEAQVKTKDTAPITQEEADYIQKVFFENDEKIRLRDGRTYTLMPLGLKDGLAYMKKVNGIDTAVIIANLIEDPAGETRYDDLLDVLLMGFKNYSHVDKDYLAEYVDLSLARDILNIMTDLNGLKKLL